MYVPPGAYSGDKIPYMPSMCFPKEFLKPGYSGFILRVSISSQEHGSLVFGEFSHSNAQVRLGLIAFHPIALALHRDMNCQLWSSYTDCPFSPPCSSIFPEKANIHPERPSFKVSSTRASNLLSYPWWLDMDWNVRWPIIFESTWLSIRMGKQTLDARLHFLFLLIIRSTKLQMYVNILIKYNS